MAISAAKQHNVASNAPARSLACLAITQALTALQKGSGSTSGVHRMGKSSEVPHHGRHEVDT